jgi:hypothetical protein
MPKNAFFGAAHPTLGIPPGVGAGNIDEILFSPPQSKGDFRISMPAPEGLDAKGTTIRITDSAGNPIGGLSPDGGVVQVGAELIGYRRIARGGIIDECIRGYLGTRACSHSNGEPVLNLSSMMNISRLEFDEGTYIGFADPSGFSPSGYVLIEDEVIGYSRISGGPILVIPSNSLGDGGGIEAAIFRGRFGTVPVKHENALVLEIPFRYWDRYPGTNETSELAYFGATKSVPGATWTKLRWRCREDKVFETEFSDKVRVLLEVRADGNPAWDGPRGNGPNAIRTFYYEWGTLKRGEDGLEMQVDDLNLRASQLEIRVYVLFEEGAYFEDAWKVTPYFEGFVVEYEKTTKVLMTETER